MNLNSVWAGFIGGIICGAIFMLGGIKLFLPKFPFFWRKEKVKDLSFFGRSTKQIYKNH